MSGGPSTVAVVIPSWNGREQLQGVLESLASQEYGEFEVVVVDNGSEDGTAEYLAESWPRVRRLAFSENRGFAAAVNHGITSTSSDYVALINNDVELDSNWLPAVVAALDEEPGAASVASKLIDWGRRNVLDGAGDMVGWDGYCVRRGKGERDRGQYDGSRSVLSACAAAALYRRRALDEVGAFDERFFAYIEDVDWGMRAQLAGWDCVYEPTAVAYHVGGVSSARISDFVLFQCHRNIIWMMVKNYPLPVLVLFAPWSLVRRLGTLLKAAAHGEATCSCGRGGRRSRSCLGRCSPAARSSAGAGAATARCWSGCAARPTPRSPGAHAPDRIARPGRGPRAAPGRRRFEPRAPRAAGRARPSTPRDAPARRGTPSSARGRRRFAPGRRP